MRQLLTPLLAALALTGAGACSSVYYDAMENLGIEKRDILVDRVKDGRRAQSDAQEEFKDALERFRSVVAVDGGKLEQKYDKLSVAYDRVEREAREVEGRIDAIEDVGKALFREWERELADYQSAELKRASAAQLRETQARYEEVVRAMNRAAAKMDPVLAIYRDQVLYLKHNLNARAIAALDAEQVVIERRVDELIAEMDRAIAEANRFIASMEGTA